MEKKQVSKWYFQCLLRCLLSDTVCIICAELYWLLFPALDDGTELDQDGHLATHELHAAYELLKCNFFNCCASVNPSQRSSVWSLKYIGCVKWPSTIQCFW